MFKHSVSVPCIVVVLAFCAGPVSAQNEGQADLDRAIDLKLNATTLAELGEVIDLCETALQKGLDEDDTEFAKKLQASTLIQRGAIFYEALFGKAIASLEQLRQLPQLRSRALADLERAIFLDPDQPRAHLMIGKLQALPGGDHRRAMAALDEAIRLQSEDASIRVDALVTRARLQTDDEQKRADFDEAVRLGPDRAEAYRQRGMYELEQGNLEAGLADLDKAIELEPDDSETHAARGLALADSGKMDEALKSLDRAIELAPESAVAYLQRARVRTAQGQSDEAMEDLDRALELQPGNLAALLMQAGLHQQQGDIDEAMKIVEQMLEARPGLVPALRARAMLNAQAGKFEEAIADVRQIQQQNPDDVEPWLQLAELYRRAQQLDKSLECYTAAIELDPQNPGAYQGRADTALFMGRQGDAKVDYERVLELTPENSSVLNNLAWLLATSPDAKLRDGERAVELATHACKITEYKQAHILSTLAAGYAEQGDFETAIEWSAKAVEIGGDEQKEPLSHELESYRKGKPWRESTPGEAYSEGEAPETAKKPTPE